VTVPPSIPDQHGNYLMPSLEHATVGEAMHPGILSCHADTSATDVARTMATHQVHCVAVLAPSHDDSGETYVWGIISDLDLLRAGIQADGQENAGALAGQPIISVKPSMPLREAAELMLTHRVTHLVVVDPGALRPVGILSSLDLAGVLAWGGS
jgi:CBS domain-containing protein